MDANICLKLRQKDINVRRNGKINYANSQVRLAHSLISCHWLHGGKELSNSEIFLIMGKC